MVVGDKLGEEPSNFNMERMKMAKRYNVGVITGSVDSDDFNVFIVSGVSLSMAKSVSQASYDYLRSQITHKKGKTLTWKRSVVNKKVRWSGYAGKNLEIEFGDE